MPFLINFCTRPLLLALALGLPLTACSANESPTEDGDTVGNTSGETGTADSGSSSETPGSSAGPTEAEVDSTGSESGSESGSSGSSGDDEPTGTTGPVCALEDDNVACDALVAGGELALRDAPTAMLRHAGPAVLTSPPAFAPEACDVYAQDCAAGMKCNPYADDGGQYWNATGCFPLDPAAAKVGEACGGGGTTGTDTCEAGALCMYSPAEGGYYCEQLCGCSGANPTCDAGEKCKQFNAGVLPLCLTICDPLAPGACADDELCAFSNYQFICQPDASGALGQLGDPCQSTNGCDAGHSCEVAPYVVGCDDGAQHCCTPLCELSAPDCPAGSHCLEYFGGFGLEAPVCLEDVGYCIADDAPLVDAPARLR